LTHAAAQQFAPRAISVLLEIMHDRRSSPAEALEAACALLDHTCGRPPSRVIEVEPEVCPVRKAQAGEAVRAAVAALEEARRQIDPAWVEHLEALVELGASRAQPANGAAPLNPAPNTAL
jgi:hypothetical protein